MKKLIFILHIIAISALILAFAQAAQAQVTSFKSSIGLTLDTLTNTIAKRMTATLPTVGYARIATIQLDITTLTGTVAGTVQAQGSIDGVTWYNTGTAYTLVSGSQTAAIKLTDGGDLYLSLLFTPSGTQSTRVRARYIRRL